MMTSEERTAALHTKMNDLQQKRERRVTRALGAASAALSLCLLILIFGGGLPQPGGTALIFSGATMLFANVGGYVLVALYFSAEIVKHVLPKNIT